MRVADPAQSSRPRRAKVVDPLYAKMLERAPQAQSTESFGDGEAWSEEFLHDTRLQQKESVAGLTGERRLALAAKREAGGDLTREEEAALEAVERFDASSH